MRSTIYSVRRALQPVRARIQRSQLPTELSGTETLAVDTPPAVGLAGLTDLASGVIVREYMQHALMPLWRTLWLAASTRDHTPAPLWAIDHALPWHTCASCFCGRPHLQVIVPLMITAAVSQCSRSALHDITAMYGLAARRYYRNSADRGPEPCTQ